MNRKGEITIQVLIALVIGVFLLYLVFVKVADIFDLITLEKKVDDAALGSFQYFRSALQSCEDNFRTQSNFCVLCQEIQLILPGDNSISVKPITSIEESNFKSIASLNKKNNEPYDSDVVVPYSLEMAIDEDSEQTLRSNNYLIYIQDDEFYIVSEDKIEDRSDVSFCTKKVLDSTISLSDLCSEYPSIMPSADTLDRTSGYITYIKSASQKYGVPEEVLAAIMVQESRGRLRLVSSAGAVGLMQFMPGTGNEFGLKIFLDQKCNTERTCNANQKYMEGIKNLAEDNRRTLDDLVKIDERFDPKKSIMAAGDFLSKRCQRYLGGENCYDEKVSILLSIYNAGAAGSGCIQIGDEFVGCGISEHPETQKYVPATCSYISYFNQNDDIFVAAAG